MKYHFGLKKSIGIMISGVQDTILQIRLPVFFLSVLTFLISLGTMVALWFLFDYHTVRTRLPDLDRLSKEVKYQDGNFQEMREQIDRITQEVNMLEENFHKTEIIEKPGINIGHPRPRYHPFPLTADRGGVREI